MKYLLTLAFSLAFLFVAAQKTVGCDVHYTDKIKNNVVQKDGLVQFVAVGVHKKRKKAQEQAERCAMEHVLFYGIPGSNLPNGLVCPEKRAEQQAWFDDFLNKKRGEWGAFISVLGINSKYSKIRLDLRKQQLGIDVRVDYKKLRLYLEDNGATCKFGL